MTSKNLYFKLMKEDARGRLWLFSLLMLIFVFMYPVAITAILSPENLATATVEDMLAIISFRVFSYFSVENVFPCFIMIGAALICGISGFSYLFSKKKTDFYHAIPVKRHILFWSNYFYGIIMVAFVFLINLFISFIIISANGIDSGRVLTLMLQTFMIHMTYFILMYTTVVAAVMMTGTMIISLLGVGVFFFFVPLACLLVQGYYATWLSSFVGFDYMGSEGLYTILILYVSPVTAYINLVKPLYEGSKYGMILIALTESAVIAFLCLLMYQRRPSEAAGKAMAFEKSKIVIKVLITIAAAMAGGLIFWQIHSTTAWVIFGILVSGILVHCLFEIIYHADFRQLFANKLHLLVCILASILIFLGFRCDITRFDRYLPEEASIESSAAYIYSLDPWVTYGKPLKRRNVRPDSNALYYWEYQSPYEYIGQNMKITDVKLIRSIAQNGIESSAQLQREDKYATRHGYYERVIIAYRLRNGQTKYRSYMLPPGNNYITYLDTLYRNPEYKQGVFPILTQTAEETASVYYQEMNHITSVPVKEKEELEHLLDAYKRDLTDLTMEDRRAESPVGMIQFRTTDLDTAVAVNSEYYDLDQRCFYPVYPSFTETIRLLETYQIVPGDQIEISSISQITIENASEKSRDWKENGTNQNYSFSDAKEIEEIYSCLVPSDYAELNDQNPMCIYLYATVYWGEGMNQSTYSYRIDKDKIPSWVKDKIGYVETDDEEEGFSDTIAQPVY